MKISNVEFYIDNTYSNDWLMNKINIPHKVEGDSVKFIINDWQMKLAQYCGFTIKYTEKV